MFTVKGEHFGVYMYVICSTQEMNDVICYGENDLGDFIECMYKYLSTYYI